MKTARKTTRLFRYDLKQITYDCTVEVMERLKRLNLVARVPEELGVDVCNIVQKVVTKTILKKKKCEKAKWLPEEALHKAEKRRDVKGKGERERHIQLNAEFQKIARRNETAFLSEQWKEIAENNTVGKTKDLFRKTGDANRIFHTKTGTIKDRNSKEELNRSKRD